MLPPGRRREAALSPFTICIAILFLFTASASAASSVLGIDFGTLNLKAALVKPGIPLEIVLTKDSKRKESAAVAFKPTRGAGNEIVAEAGAFPERAYGSDALSLQGRMPGEVFPNLKPLLGLPWSSQSNAAVQAYNQRYPALQAQQLKEMGTTVFKSSAFAESEMPWSVEELLAMELVNVRKNAESMAGTVEDVVITIPAFYTADEKRAIERAADLAGLEVNALVSDGLAVGLDYAKSRTFPEVSKGEKPEYHMVFDMGAGSTTATLMRFQGKSVKDVGRFNKTVQGVAVMGTGWDRTLGGDSLNNVILNNYVQKFLEKPEVEKKGLLPADIMGNGRVMSRLWKEAEKARQVLSANTETSSGFEELLPDIDFRAKLSRFEFEMLAAEYADRVVGPVEDALMAANMQMKDVDSIIMHGGAIRTPFVQKKLEDLAGSSGKVRTNVNADESAVFGATFKGAGLSPSFKVKEIRDSDVSSYPIGMTYKDGNKERRQGLFSNTSPVGSGATTKQVTFNNKEDFHFDLYQKIGEVSRTISKVQTQNLTESVKALKEKFGCEVDEVSTKFNLRLNPVNGLPEAASGTVSCEVEGSGKGVGDSVKDWLGFGRKKDQEALGEDEEGTIEPVDDSSSSVTSAVDADSATSSSDSSSSSSAAPEKPKKRTESISIKFTASAQGNPQPAPAEMKRMRDRLAAFERSDSARFAREEALNTLESYTYHVRDFLENSDYEGFSTPAQRQEIEKVLGTTKEFMEEPQEISKADESTLKSKLKALKGLVEPIKNRRKEGQVLPEKIEGLQESLRSASKFMDTVKEQIAKASSASSEAAESAASSTTSKDATEESAPPADDLDDLDDPSSSTGSSVAPKATVFSSPFSDADLTSLQETHASITSWLEDQIASQAALAPHDDPVLLVKDVEAKAEQMGGKMQDLIYKQIRAQKEGEKASKSTTGGKKKTKEPKKKKATSVTESPEAEEETQAAESSTSTHDEL